MQRQFNMYRRLIVIGMIMLMEFSLSQVWAFTQSFPSSRNNAPASAAGSTLPGYRFRSTSPLLDGGTPYTGNTYSTVSGGSDYNPREKGPWDDDPDPGEPGIGEVDNPLPVGEPYCLLLMAAAYCLFSYRRKKA